MYNYTYFIYIIKSCKIHDRFLMVFMCLSLSVFSTIEEYEAKAGIVLFYMETVVVIWFAIEFFLR